MQRGRVSDKLVVVTAADRAAATFAALGDEPLRPPRAGTSPFRGGFVRETAKRLSPKSVLPHTPFTKTPMANAIGVFTFPHPARSRRLCQPP